MNIRNINKEIYIYTTYVIKRNEDYSIAEFVRIIRYKTIVYICIQNTRVYRCTQFKEIEIYKITFTLPQRKRNNSKHYLLSNMKFFKYVYF